MQLRIWRKIFFLVILWFLVLSPFQALALPTLDCDSPMDVVTQGIGGQHAVSALAGVDNIVSFSLIGTIPAGITLGSIVGLNTPSTSGLVTVDSSVTAGDYTVELQAVDGA